jgi:hypothetical protein
MELLTTAQIDTDDGSRIASTRQRLNASVLYTVQYTVLPCTPLPTVQCTTPRKAHEKKSAQLLISTC